MFSRTQGLTHTQNELATADAFHSYVREAGALHAGKMRKGTKISNNRRVDPQLSAQQSLRGFFIFLTISYFFSRKINLSRRSRWIASAGERRFPYTRRRRAPRLKRTKRQPTEPSAIYHYTCVCARVPSSSGNSTPLYRLYRWRKNRFAESRVHAGCGIAQKLNYNGSYRADNALPIWLQSR